MTTFSSEKTFSSLHALFFEKFINLLTTHGKKTKALKIFFSVLTLLDEKAKIYGADVATLSAGEIFEIGIKNCAPNLQVRKVRVAGTTYLVPAILAKKKQEALAMRWIIEAAKKKKKTSRTGIAVCLADEIFDAYLHQGAARAKRNECHRLAEANRAYTRYRWW